MASAAAEMDSSSERRLHEALAAAREGRAAELRRDLSEALGHYQRSRDLLAGLEPVPLLANLLRWIGSVHRDLGDIEQADESYRESVQVAEQTGARSGQASALNCRAVIAQRRGDLDLAVRLYRRAARIAAEAGEIRLAGMIEQNLGVLSNIRGDLDGALVRYRAALRAFQQVADDEAVSWVLNNMGMLLNDLGLQERAEKQFLKGLAIARARRDRSMEGILLANYAEGLIAMRRWNEANDSLERALSIASSGQDPIRRAEVLKFQGILERERGSHARAAALFAEALGIAEQADDPLLTAELLRERGDLRLREGDADGAMADWVEALDRFVVLHATLDAEGIRTRLASIPQWTADRTPTRRSP